MVVYLNNDGIASSRTEGNLKVCAVWIFGVALTGMEGVEGGMGSEVPISSEAAELDWKGGSFLFSYCFCTLILEKDCCCKAAFLKGILTIVQHHSATFQPSIFRKYVT